MPQKIDQINKYFCETENNFKKTVLNHLFPLFCISNIFFSKTEINLNLRF